MIELAGPLRVRFLTREQRIDASLRLRDDGLLRFERAFRRRELLPLLIDKGRWQQVCIPRDELHCLPMLAAPHELRDLCADALLRELLHTGEQRTVWSDGMQLVEIRALRVDIRERGLLACQRRKRAFQ